MRPDPAAESRSPFRGFGPGGVRLDVVLAAPTHPGATRLLRYCAERCEGRPLLRRQDVVPRDLASILPDLFILEPAGDDWRYRLAGGTILLHSGIEFTGKRLREICASATAAEAKRLFDSVARRRQPAAIRSSYSVAGQRQVVFEAVHVPMLARNSETLHVLGGMFFF